MKKKAEPCTMCGKPTYLKSLGQPVCSKHKYLIYIKEWKHCPLCGSKADFEPRGIAKNYLRCRNCSAEWEVEVKFRGEPEKIRLNKPSADGTGSNLVASKTSGYFPFDWWVKTDLAKIDLAKGVAKCGKCGKVFSSWFAKILHSTEDCQRFEREQIAKGLVKFVDVHGVVKWGTPAEVIEWKKRKDRLVSLIDNQFDELTSGEFWDLIGHLFVEMGYEVPESWFKKSYSMPELTREKGGTIPYIVLKKGNQEILATAAKTPVGFVRTDISVLSFLDAMQKAGIKYGIFVTNTGFSDEAIQVAEGQPVELWDHEKLRAIISGHFDSLASKIVSMEKERLKLQQDLDALDPKEFERWVGSLLRGLGYDVEDLPFVGDYGADLIARKPGEVVVVQCKKYSPSHRVGARDVQMVLGSMSYYKANRAILATTSDFTKQAKNQAKGAPIELWDRKALLELRRRIEKKGEFIPPNTYSSTHTSSSDYQNRETPRPWNVKGKPS